MGNSGIRKIFFGGDSVETPFRSIHEIPLVTLDKNETMIEKGQPLLFMILTPKSIFFEGQIKDYLAAKQELESKGVRVVGLATNTFSGRSANFDEIKAMNIPFSVFPWVVHF